MAEITALKCENLVCPLGLDEAKPRFSWEILSGEQRAFTLTVTDETGETLFGSGCVESARHFDVEYGGAPLKPKTRYFWTVNAGGETRSSFFETGLMGGKLPGRFITSGKLGPAYLRKRITLSENVKRAVLRSTALGVYEVRVNGVPAGDEKLLPGWTMYSKRLRYQTNDVTDLLVPGENAMSVTLSEGWFKGDIVTLHHKNVQKEPPRFLCALEVEYVSGRRETFSADSSWRFAPRIPLIMSDFYQGAEYDARLEMPGWDRAGFDDSAWQCVSETGDEPVLFGRNDPPVREIAELKNPKLLITPKGENLLDFGQNLVGYVRFSVKGEAGRRVTIKHAEALDKDGNFYNENYRAARAETVYTLKGGQTETFAPPLTFYGFRYIKLENWPGEVNPADFTAVVMSSDLERTAGFDCSDAQVNRLYQNILWGQRGNFVDVPTDCPQRDERLGWTGDCQAFARTACINLDCDAMLRRWLIDLKLEQREDGAVTNIVPNCFSPNSAGIAAWGDAVTIVPRALYECYGDTRVLKDMYPAMRKWLEYIASQSENGLWSKGKQLGDWLGLDAREGSYEGKTDKTLIATAFWARSAEITLNTARVLGFKADEAALENLLSDIKAAYRREYITQEGRLRVNTQTAYALTLRFKLCEDRHRAPLAADFRALIEESGHLTTGFVGTPHLCCALTECGLHETAGKLFLNRDYPSWLYPVSKGATTMWEHWDGIKPDGSFWSSDMNSFNHYAYGAIGEWMFRYLAGIDPSLPGYTAVALRPRPIEGLSYVSAWQKTPCGRIECGWKKEKDGEYTVRCLVPCGCAAALVTADGEIKLAPGEHTIKCRL